MRNGERQVQATSLSVLTEQSSEKLTAIKGMSKGGHVALHFLMIHFSGRRAALLEGWGT